MPMPPFTALPSGRMVKVDLDGQQLSLPEGANLAAMLLAAGILRFGDTAHGSPRGPNCLMGACHGCAMTIDGHAQQRSCRTTVRAGMVLRTRQ